MLEIFKKKTPTKKDNLENNYFFFIQIQIHSFNMIVSRLTKVKQPYAHTILNG